jgi:hypothetical protein
MNSLISASTPDARIGGAGDVQRVPPRLVTHLGTQLLRQARQRLGHGLVQGQRALAAAEHEQARGAAAVGETHIGHRQRGDRGAHGVADHLGADAVGERARERREHAARDPREQPVGRAGDRILLMDHQRPARQPGRDPAGTRGITAHAEHHRGTHPQYDAQRLQHRQADLERRREARAEVLAAQSPDGDPFDRDARLRHDARLEAETRAHPDDLDLARAQRIRDGQRREHVPAGAARHDQHARAHRDPLIGRRPA